MNGIQHTTLYILSILTRYYEYSIWMANRCMSHVKLDYLCFSKYYWQNFQRFHGARKTAQELIKFYVFLKDQS